MKDGTVMKRGDYLRIKEKEDTINYALKLSGPAFAKYVAALHRAERKNLAEALRVAWEMMLERRAAVDEVVLTIQKEQADSEGETWSKHYDIDKFVSEVNGRADLREMLEVEGATINDVRLRLEYLRREKVCDRVAGSDVRLPPRGTSWIFCKG